MSVNLLVRVLTRHKNVDDGKGTKTISSMMSRFFASGSRKKKSTGRRDHGQSAMMDANTIELVESGPEQIVFNRISDNQTLRCCFDFSDLTASFMEI